MPPREHDTIAALIDRVVADARIPSRAKREDLRRELFTHFEDVCPARDSVETALRRFGPERAVADSFRRVYRVDFILLHLGRIAAAIAASLLAALVVQIAINVRVDLQADVWRLGPAFSRSFEGSAALVLGVVTAFEVTRRPFNYLRTMVVLGCYFAVWAVIRLLFGAAITAPVLPTCLVILGWLGSRLDSPVARTLLIFVAFAAALYASHLPLKIDFTPTRAVVAGAALLAVWSSTAAILRRLDRFFEFLMARTR